MFNSQYPLNLTSSEFGNTYIQFKFFEYIQENYNDSTRINENNLNNANKSAWAKQKGSTVLSSGSATFLGLKEGLINGVAKVKALDLSVARIERITGMIKFPTPLKVNNNNTISWSDEDATKLAILGVSTNSITETINEDTSTDDFLKRLASNVVAWKSTTKENSILNLQAKTTSNDFTDQAFSNVEKRTLNFEWDFLITTRQEATTLKKIIEFIEERTLPKVVNGNIGSIGQMFVTYPDSLNIYFIKNGKENEYLPKYGDMVITTFNVEYGDDNSNGFYTYEDGSPVRVKISLGLKEKNSRVANIVKRTYNL